MRGTTEYSLYFYTIFQSQLLSRLAAAHRGAIRALQAFVTQLEDHDWSTGLPRTHQELTLLVRQLALSCAQLEVATGQDVVPDAVVNLIRDMKVRFFQRDSQLNSFKANKTGEEVVNLLCCT